MRRLLGVDLGDRRIGLAVADSEASIARPLTTIRRGGSVRDDAAAIRRHVEEQQAVEIVVGLPLDASGAEGPMAVGARTWAAELAPLLGLPVTLRDERLSSFVAEGRLGRPARGRSGGPPTRMQREARRARIDREAAAVILQDELDARAAAR
ncbi:MAG: Holliday junction resolvase RuvX [Chloroflexota bacterium]